MESQVKAAEAAVKAYVKKWEGISADLYEKYMRKPPEVIASFDTHAKDVEDLKLAIQKLDRLAGLVTLVPAAAGSHGGSGAQGTMNMRTLLKSIEKSIADAKKLKPPPAPPKPPAAAAKPLAAPKPAAPGAKASPNAGRPLPKLPGKPNAYADPNKKR